MPRTAPGPRSTRRFVRADSAPPARHGCGRTRRPDRAPSPPVAPPALDPSVEPAGGGIAPPAASGRRVIGEEQRAGLAGAAADRDADIGHGPCRRARDRLERRERARRGEMEPPVAGHPGELLAPGTPA